MPVRIASIADTTTKKVFTWQGVNWAPGQSTTEEILQAVYCVLGTPVGTQVLNRAFGIFTRFIDKPQNVALPLIRWLFQTAIAAWEPRFRVTSVSFAQTTGEEALNGIVDCAITGYIDAGEINPYRGILANATVAPSPLIVTATGAIIHAESAA